MKFKPFQLHDYAAAAMSEGLVCAHDTGLGKSLGAATIPLLWLGFDKDEEKSIPKIRGSVLIVAPGDLHDQLKAEFQKFYGITPADIRDQSDVLRLLRKDPHSPPSTLHPPLPKMPPGFYLTSYTRLAVNGVRKIESLLKCGIGTVIEEFNLLPRDLQEFWENRGVTYKNEYATLGLNANATQKQLDAALKGKQRIIATMDDRQAREARDAEVRHCHAFLSNFVPPFAAVAFGDADQMAGAKFVWRELVTRKIEEYSASIGETRGGVKCVYSPSVADLCSHHFDCVVIDEGVKMKGSDTAVGKGIRQMSPKYRLVLTATPVKNRLPDIFWLAWWASGGHEKASGRWPYDGAAGEQEKFAETFMLSEFNRTKAEDKGGAKSRFSKLRPEICNIHLLWKALGPVVLRRRKGETELTEHELRKIGCAVSLSNGHTPLVKKIRHVYRVPMGRHQRAVYQYHLEAEYLDCHMQPAPGAKLQALRVASAAPDSHLLEPQRQPRRREESKVPGTVPLIHRSPHSFTPKVAGALTLIRDILARGEQAAVFSAFNDPSDILSRYLHDAGIDHFLLDGRMAQAKRGRRSAAFNAGECPVTLAGIDSMAEGHNWDNVNNIILTSYTWAADKIIQAINRAHRLTSKKDVNLYVIICDQSADRVLEDNINEKTNSSELAIDGRLLGEVSEEKSIGELLRDAMRDFNPELAEGPDESELVKTWPALCAELRAAHEEWHHCGGRAELPLRPDKAPFDLASFQFPDALGASSPAVLAKADTIPAPIPLPTNRNPLIPSWRRFRTAGAVSRAA